MLKRKMITRILAVTAAMTLIMPMAVFADDEDDIDGKVYVDATQEDVKEEIGDVTAETEDVAVFVKADNGHNAEVTTGNLTSDNDSGLLLMAYNDSMIVATANGDTVGGEYGACAESYSDGMSFAEVKGISVGGGYGAAAYSENGGGAAVWVRGDALGADTYSEGLAASTYEKINPGDEKKAAGSTVDVAGDAIGNSDGINAWAYGGFNEVVVGGNVIGIGLDHPYAPQDEYAVTGICASAIDKGENDVLVAGNAEGRDYGIFAEAFSGGSNNIVVEGTVSGEKAGIISEGESVNSNRITVWKVETGDDGVVAGKIVEAGPDEYTVVEDPDMLANIQYIIKVEQPTGGTLTATDSEGNALATVTAVNGNVYEYAHESDKVLLKIELDKDFGIDAVYGDKGQTLELVKDASGNYYVVVPRGGGVCFSAVLTKKSRGSSGEPDTPANPAPAAGYTPAPAAPGAAVTAEVQASVSAINDTPAGGTAEIAVSDSKIDASIVATLLARRDINVTFTCFINGKLRKITIPAGADIKELIEADGTINVEKLAEKFDKTE